ncbi:hypothetical protein MNBD_GAMMA09-2218 [hydrothermal vent metagenome]|uniref:Large ribosomal RNA subunit accumulation protein YceD n=1 Tax=hydrothermal vent metagenome TaxID=652676 RepID=A0A3B0Y0Q0_9ZZZZ
MKPTLPVYLNFVQKANIGTELQGNWPISRLKRLSEALLSNEGDVKVELVFDRAGRIPFIEGHLRAELKLKCQRCMQEMAFVVDNRFKLGLVLNEKQMTELPDEYEPYLVKEDNNFLPDILEDELLLSLPLVAMHDFDCSEHLVSNTSDQDNEVGIIEPEEGKKNPFAVLKDLL